MKYTWLHLTQPRGEKITIRLDKITHIISIIDYHFASRIFFDGGSYIDVVQTVDEFDESLKLLDGYEHRKFEQTK